LLDNKNYQAQVIFTTGAKKDDRDSQAAAYLLNKAAAGSARNILAEWYSSAFRNADLPVSKEQAENKVAQHAAHLQAMYNWCVQEKIEITPTIYVNGRRLPGQYTIHDLIHMHDE
jgi:hypothetical protein